MIKLAPRSSLLALSLVLAAGCSDLGTHQLAIEGSDAVTQGIDAAASDGWTVTFDSFVVVVHDPGLIERLDNKPTWVRENGVTVWDVAVPLEEGEALSRQIRATRYDAADFRIAPVSVSGYDAVAGNVSDDVLDAAVEDDWSIHVVGSATDGTDTVNFDWTFDTNTFYRCAFEDDEDIVLDAEGDETTVIEILGEVLLRGDSGGVVFQPIADAAASGVVGNAELEAAGLMDAIAALTAEIGGVRGVGVCPEYEPPEDEEG